MLLHQLWDDNLRLSVSIATMVPEVNGNLLVFAVGVEELACVIRDGTMALGPSRQVQALDGP